MSEQTLKNKFAIVTGSSTGIGQAIALKLAKAGAFVALVGRSEDKLLKTKSLITTGGGNSGVFLGDFTKQDSVEALVAAIKQQTNHIDFVVNVAGIWHGQDSVYANTDFDLFESKVISNTYAVGLLAPTLLVHSFIPLMPEGSQILNISGTFENGAKGWLPYYVSKKGIEELTYGLAQELADKKIYVNAISPSDTATEEYKKWFPEDALTALEPEKIAELAYEILTSTKTGTIQTIKNGIYTAEDVAFTKQAIEMAQRSFDEGAFPAGAILVKDGVVVSSNTSVKYPKIIYHAESKTIDEAMDKLDMQLTDCTLYTSMEPCLMCLSRAYWAGIRKIYFAIKKESVNYKICYESNHNHFGLLEKFNEKIELVHITELEEAALKIVFTWQKQNNL